MLFFNPFSVEILQKVLARIYESYYENPREILLMFYYPSEEYISCLMTEEALMFVDEISTEDLFEVKNERERIDYPLLAHFCYCSMVFKCSTNNSWIPRYSPSPFKIGFTL